MTLSKGSSDPPTMAGLRRRWPSLRPWPNVPATLADPVRALEFRHLGRILLHSALVGVAVGAVACIFFAALEWTQHLLLDRLAGYMPLRPAGERTPEIQGWTPGPLLPWILALTPAAGALASGLIAHWTAPEAMGGGGDGYIDAFHSRRGLIRKRVAPVKVATSVLTLGSGGSGGREGPTMLIGAAMGALVARMLRLSSRERRLLLVAGAAGGMAAIFRCPLGAALLAVDVLYREDFEADALIPAILASVTAYSVFVTVFPSASHLFEHASRYAFDPRQLPLYIVMAVVLSLGALLFASTLRAVKVRIETSSLPRWLRPAVGGLFVGLIAVGWILVVNPKLHLTHRGIGILGSGYGAAQGAITSGAWVPSGWRGVEVLATLALVKIIGTACTIGSGGSAGDFGPSLTIGALLGGAFGRAAQFLVNPAIDPGAFALVGMGAFYGGLAHVPLSAAVLVCELAGSYDLLVPLMLTEGVAFVILRRTDLYHGQVRSRFDSPAHAGDGTLDVLKALRAGATVPRNREFVTLPTTASLRQVFRTVSGAAPWQDTFPVLDSVGQLVGLVSSDAIRTLLYEEGLERVAVAADIMGPVITVSVDDDMHAALERLLEAGVRSLPVVNESGAIVGLLDEADVVRAYHLEITRRHSDAGAEGIAPQQQQPRS